MIALVLFAGACGPPAPGPVSSPPAATAREVEEAVATALAYPYERMPTSYLFVNGKTYDYAKLGADPLRDGEIKLEDGRVVRVEELLAGRLAEIGGKLPDAMKDRVPVVGYGSNGAPSALRRKFTGPGFARGWAVVPVLKGKLRDFEVVHAAHFYTNGNLPATIQYARGAEQESYVTFLDREELERMHRTEGIDSASKRTWYSYGRLRHVELTIDGGPTLSEVYAYIDNYGALAVGHQTYALSAVGGVSRSPKASQEQILELSEPETEGVKEPPEAAASCGALSGVRRFLCGSFVSPCVRDGRTAALQQRRSFVPFALPPSSGISYEVLAGAEVPGNPDALPASSRCPSIP